MITSFFKDMKKEKDDKLFRIVNLLTFEMACQLNEISLYHSSDLRRTHAEVR